MYVNQIPCFCLCISLIRETHASQPGNKCFPVGKRRKIKCNYPFLFLHINLKIYVKDGKGKFLAIRCGMRLVRNAILEKENIQK